MTIREFLAGIGLEQYTEVFEENGIEVEILPELEESDLPDLGIKLLGHRKKLMKAIRLQGPSSSGRFEHNTVWRWISQQLTLR